MLSNIKASRREKQLQASRKWKAANKSRMAEYHREWVARNPKKAKVIEARCSTKRKEQRREYGRFWREKNKERNKEQKRIYYELNKEHISQRRKREYWADRPAKLLEANHGIKASDAPELLASYANGCMYCGSHEHLEVDHKTPKSRGGLNDATNYQWLCRRCNRCKWDMTEVEFFEHIRKILKMVDAGT